MTRGNPAREAERAAIEIVSRWVAGRGTVGPPEEGEGDFRVRYSDGRWADGEVKTDFDESTQALWSALLSLHREQVVELPEGYGGWGASLTARASVKALKRELPGVIQGLRLRGIDYYDVRVSWEPLDVQQQFLALGLEYLSLSTSASEDVCILFPPSVAGAVPLDAECAIPWINRCLVDPRYSNSWNRLALSNADEKHAFIWIESAAPEDLLLRVSFHPDEPPRTRPEIPEWLTHLWVGIPTSFESTHWSWLLMENGWQAIAHD
jgi:hypothetical protein